MRWRLFGTVSILLLSGALADAAFAQFAAPSGDGAEAVANHEKAPTPVEARLAAVAANPADYIVHSGDVLKVFVWKEPDLSGDVQVRLDGKITVLLVGDVVAAGRNPMQIAAMLEERLARFVEAPAVTVLVAQANSSRYYMLGQVAKPGMYPLTSRTTVVQALAIAGGFVTFAKTDRILVIHDQVDPLEVERVDYDKIKDGDTKKNYELQAGDTILVP